MSTTTARLIRSAWSVLSWIVLTGLVTGVTASLYYYQRAEGELRNLFESRLGEIYPNLTVRVGSARILQGEGIRLGQISVLQADGRSTEERSEIAYIELLTLRCDASLPALLQRKLSVRHIVCQGLTVHAERYADGAWNLSKLIPAKPPASCLDPLPQITIEGASWQLRDVRDEQAKLVKGEDVNLRIRLKSIDQNATAPPAPAAGMPNLLVAVEGSFRTPYCQRVELEGVARTTDGAWTLQGHVTGATWSPEMCGKLPSFMAVNVQRLATLRGRAEVQFQLGRKSRNLPLSYQVSGHVSEGHWQDARWNQPISNISCDFTVDPSGCHARQLIANFGTARLGGEFAAAGHDLSQPYELTLTIDRFPLTRAFVAGLPASVQETWQKFRAEGIVSGAIQVRFDGRDRRYSSELKVRELSLKHYKFPYPITDCQGTLNLSNDLCQFEIAGSAGGTPVDLRGVIHQPGPRFTGWWEAKTTRWKAIDDTLIGALPPQVETFIRRLQLRGHVGFWVRHERDKPLLGPPPEMIVALDQGWINYDGFPYPISNVQGRLESHNGRWSFKELTGWNDDCQIVCDGSWDTQDPSKPLDLRFELRNLGLDDELKHALQPSAQQVWSQLRPRGRLNRVNVHLFKTVDLARPELDIQLTHINAEPSSETIEGLQLQPSWLPLRFSNVQGEARLRGSSLVLRNVSGKHGKLRFQANGSGESRPDGRWTMNLTNLIVDRLELTEAVLQALPAPLAHSIAAMELGGTFSLAGAMRLERDDRSAPVASSWDLSVNVEQGRLNNGMAMVGIFGQIDMDGASRGGQFWSRGNMRLDSLVSKGVQLTAIDGPFWLDSARILFGQRVPPQTANEVSRPVTATVYEGKASANAEVMLNRDRDFSVQVNVTNADLTKLSRDWQLGQGNLAGQVFLELFLTGSNRGRNSLRGHGTGQLRNASLYELPLILALLNRMGSGRTDNTAFTSSDVAFHISDDYVYFDRFDLTGDAITLKGIGEMSLDRQLSLDFYSLVGREQLWNPIVRPFVGEASRQFLLIHLDGTLSNPRTTQEVLPGLNETLQQLFPELTNAAAGPPQAANRNDRGPFTLLPRWR